MEREPNEHFDAYPEASLPQIFGEDAVSRIKQAFDNSALKELSAVLSGDLPDKEIDQARLRARVHYWALKWAPKPQQRIHSGPVVTEETRDTAKKLSKKLESVIALANKAPQALHHLLTFQLQDAKSHQAEDWADWLHSSQEFLRRLEALASTKFPRGRPLDNVVHAALLDLGSIFHDITGKLPSWTYDPVEGKEIGVFHIFVYYAFEHHPELKKVLDDPDLKKTLIDAKIRGVASKIRKSHAKLKAIIPS